MSERKVIVLDKDIEKLKKEIKILWDERENNERTLRQKIRELAQRIENGYLEANETYKVCTIAGTIIGWYEANKSLQQYIDHTLDERYKRHYDDKTINSVTDTFPESLITSETFVEVLQDLKKIDKYSFDRRGVQEIAQLAKDIKDDIEDWAEDAKVPLPYQKSTLGDSGNKEEKVSLEAALPPDDKRIEVHSNHYIATLEGIRGDIQDMLEDVRDKNYMANNPDDEEQRNVGAHAFRLLLKPHQDKKWQRFWREWCDIIRMYYEYGGTRASGSSAVDVTDVINKKTGSAERRKVTKEQIDAKYIPYLNEMRFIVLCHNPYDLPDGPLKNVRYGIDMDTGKLVIRQGRELTKEQLEVLHDKILDAMIKLLDNWKWLSEDGKIYRQTEEGLRAKRAHNLHGKLSDAA